MRPSPTKPLLLPVIPKRNAAISFFLCSAWAPAVLIYPSIPPFSLTIVSLTAKFEKWSLRMAARAFDNSSKNAPNPH